LASVRIVSGLSVCALSAQAPSMDRPAVTATAAAGGTAAAVLRKLRRSILLTIDFSHEVLRLVFYNDLVVVSAETAATLDNLDIVAVGILDEEEAS
jgi:hypothetical protein